MPKRQSAADMPRDKRYKLYKMIFVKLCAAVTKNLWSFIALRLDFKLICARYSLTERWQSGRMHRTRNAAWAQVHRGFKSLPLRHIFNI